MISGGRASVVRSMSKSCDRDRRPAGRARFRRRGTAGAPRSRTARPTAPTRRARARSGRGSRPARLRKFHRQWFDVRRSMSVRRPTSECRSTFDVRWPGRRTTVTAGEFRPSRRSAWPSARRAIGPRRRSSCGAGRATRRSGIWCSSTTARCRRRWTSTTGSTRRPSSGLRAVRTGAMFPRAAEVFADAGFVTIDTLALLELDLRTTRRPSIRLETKRLTRRQTREAVAIDRRAFGARWANDSASLAAIRRATPTYRARQLSVDGRARRVRDQRHRRFDRLPAAPGGRSPPPARRSGQVARRRRVVLDARSSPRQRARQHGDRQRGRRSRCTTSSGSVNEPTGSRSRSSTSRGAADAAHRGRVHGHDRDRRARRRDAPAGAAQDDRSSSPSWPRTSRSRRTGWCTSSTSSPARFPKRHRRRRRQPLPLRVLHRTRPRLAIRRGAEHVGGDGDNDDNSNADNRDRRSRARRSS